MRTRGSADADGDDEWPDPDPDAGLVPALDRRQVGLRLGCSLLVLVMLVLLTRGVLPEALSNLWPPTDPLGQWTMLVLLHLFGYVILPLMVGSMIADTIGSRLLASLEDRFE